jgi:ribosome-dependent ATPase
MAFAVFGPVILMLAFGYGISFDIENLATASFDQDNTPQSRELLQGFEGSCYFSMQPPIKSAEEGERRLRSGNTQIVVEVPPGFGGDLLNKRQPEVDTTVDGAMTFRGETARNYVKGVVSKQGEELQRQINRPGSPNAWRSDDIETRFRYNQAWCWMLGRGAHETPSLDDMTTRARRCRLDVA